MPTLAIFGGTFNPVHKGHEQMLKAIDELSFVEKILIIPSKIPPHKETDFLASESHRLDMCRVLASSSKKAEVSDIEFSRNGKSYTIDTLKALKNKYPEYTLALVIGGDMLTTFTEWKDYKEILKKADIIAFGRMCVKDSDFTNSAELLRAKGGNIILIDEDIIDISSTEIRNSIKDKDLLDKYLPSKIKEYIIENNVYEK